MKINGYVTILIHVLLIVLSNDTYGQKASSSLVEKYIICTQLINSGNIDNSELELNNLLRKCEDQGYYNLASICCSTLGRVYSIKGNNEKARMLFEKGIDLGEKSPEVSGKALNLASLGWILQDVEAAGKDHVKDGIDLLLNDDTKDEFRNLALGHLYTGLMFAKTKSPDSINVRLKSAYMALHYYRKTPAYFDRKMYLSQTYINIASLEHRLKNYDLAIMNLKKARELVSETAMFQNFLINNELSADYNGKKKYDSAIIYGNRALKLITEDTQSFGTLKLYKNLIEAYENTGQTLLSEEFSKKYLELENKLNKNKMKSVVGIANEASKKADHLRKTNAKLLWVFVFIISMLLSVIYCFKTKYKREKVAFENFQRNRNGLIEASVRKTDNERNPTDTISNDTENLILQSLISFEKKNQFIEKGINQGILATRLNTNVRYLSAIIKKHKGDSFNSYLNSLRINYILQKIETDAEYRKYKISYLAEECGYPTPSSFNRVFKEITGVTPSSYLQLLNEKNKKETFE